MTWPEPYVRSLRTFLPKWCDYSAVRSMREEKNPRFKLGRRKQRRKMSKLSGCDEARRLRQQILESMSHDELLEYALNSIAPVRSRHYPPDNAASVRVRIVSRARRSRLAHPTSYL